MTDLIFTLVHTEIKNTLQTIKKRRKHSLTGEVQSRTISIPEEDESEDLHDYTLVKNKYKDSK